MRSLAQPETMRAAAAAAAISGLAGYAQLASWTDRSHALWFLAAALTLSSFILWSFVFGWYPRQLGKDVLRSRLPARDWIVTILFGLAGALVLAAVVDPRLRPLKPGDYPETLPDWIAGALFSLSFSHLVVCYAPMAFFLRLSGHPKVAVFLTVALGEFLLGLQLNAASIQLDLPFTLLLYGVRAVLGWAAAWVFLRGGVVLGTVWTLLLEGRLLVMLL